MCLVRAGRLIVSVVAGNCSEVSGTSLFVKQLLPGVDPVAMTMSLVLPIEEGRSIRLAGSLWQNNDASATDGVAGWAVSGAVVDRVVRALTLVVPR